MRTKQLKDRAAKIQRLQFIKSLIERNPKPALNGLDDKLEKYLNYTDGFFVELGANDGYTQSNTFYLEYCKNWRGLLIEGIPELYTRCEYTRIHSHVMNYACVDGECCNKNVTMNYANLMSIVTGAMKSTEADKEHLDRGLQCQNIFNSYQIEVPAKTLTAILEEVGVEKIDFLSLDVEGYEANVLRGLAFDRYAPEYICVEARFFDDVNKILCSRYSLVEQLTHHDYLYHIDMDKVDSCNLNAQVMRYE